MLLIHPLPPADCEKDCQWYHVLHRHCASLHDGSDGGHVNVRTPEVLIIFQHGNNIINGVFYWYRHSKLTIIHEKLPAIRIWHIQKNCGLFSAQIGSRGTSPGVPKTGTVSKNII